MQEHKQSGEEYSFYDFFVPLTPKKAIFWIIIIGFIVFFNSLFGEFLIDDIIQIVNNPIMHSVGNVLSFFTAPATVGAEKSLYYYRPVPYALYAIFFTLFGQ